MPPEERSLLADRIQEMGGGGEGYENTQTERVDPLRFLDFEPILFFTPRP
ncbi:MAG: hypothetical protein Q7T11_09620 [Deltaproteobacteria bacterium]|nr:hypothetical protein [Deltaproteobacteria bacterium]